MTQLPHSDNETLHALKLERNRLIETVKDVKERIRRMRSLLLTDLAPFHTPDTDPSLLRRRVQHVLSLPQLVRFITPSTRKRHDDLCSIFHQIVVSAKHSVLSVLWKIAVDRETKYAEEMERPVEESWSEDKNFRALYDRMRTLHLQRIASRERASRAARITERFRYLGHLLGTSTELLISGNARCMVACEQIGASLGEVFQESTNNPAPIMRSARLARLEKMRLSRDKLQAAVSSYYELYWSCLLRSEFDSHHFRLAAVEQAGEEAVEQQRSKKFCTLAKAVINTQRRIMEVKMSSEKLRKKCLNLRIFQSQQKASLNPACDFFFEMSNDGSGHFHSSKQARAQFLQTKIHVVCLWRSLKCDPKEIIAFVCRLLQSSLPGRTITDFLIHELRRLESSEECLRMFHSNTSEVEMINSCFKEFSKQEPSGGVDVYTAHLLDAVSLGVRQRISATETAMIRALQIHDRAVRGMMRISFKHRNSLNYSRTKIDHDNHRSLEEYSTSKRERAAVV